MKKISAGIIGGAGYTGGELIRLLIRHPYVSVSFIHSRSNAGKPVHSVHQVLLGETDLQFTGELSFPSPTRGGQVGADVLFLCVGHGEAKKFLEQTSIPANTKIIDLSQDFRLKQNNGQLPTINGQPFVYGLPELNRDEIRTAHNVANPGCFATAVQLGLLPLAKAGLLSTVYATGITGSTGAGQSLSPTSHFSWRANNIQPYKTLTHQHLKEITQSLQQLQPSPRGEAPEVRFVPWRGDFTRGIFISSQMHCDKGIEDVTALYEAFYADHPYTTLSREPIFLKQVVNTNKCVLQLEKIEDTLVVHSAIDNLLKGASGQAVQNMNLMFGFDECEGLNLKANYF
ncbi:MAG: N-acetyl-gamma-glutamyl-phosphate reductase [Flavisolibacter sp.]|nr:N-acetyl-gamma-glutamyl-phosphate reductase [Flavisolibacter sp.]